MRPECIYCSGPLFCPEEIGGMTALAATLESAGFRTFLPHRDGLEAYLLAHVNGPGGRAPARVRKWIDKAIFALDVYYIVERCEALVFNMNGRVPDEGACVEAGIAFAIGKPVVLYKSDVISAFYGFDNSMLRSLSPLPLVEDLHRLPDAVKKALKSPGCRSCELSPSLMSAARLGGRIRRVLEKLPGGPRSVNRDVAEEIARYCLSHR